MPEEIVEEQPIQTLAGGRSGIAKVLLIALLVLASSAGGGIVSFVLISRMLDSQAKAAEDPQRAEKERVALMLQNGAVLPLEPFVVNLADTDAARYLRIKVSLMVDSKANMKEFSDNQALQLKLRDVILESLTAKTSQDLIRQDGKNKLRHEILQKAAVYFRESNLVDVMFTEFVIQL